MQTVMSLHCLTHKAGELLTLSKASYFYSQGTQLLDPL